MPLELRGSCRCGGVRFRCATEVPQPYQRCYCSICRKTAGGGGYAINIGALSRSLVVEAAPRTLTVFRAEIADDADGCWLSTAERNFCARCATSLWLFSPESPALIHPFAAAIDSELPVPRASVHMMLRFKPGWVTAAIAAGDAAFDMYPAESLEEWHRRNGVWVE